MKVYITKGTHGGKVAEVIDLNGAELKVRFYDGEEDTVLRAYTKPMPELGEVVEVNGANLNVTEIMSMDNVYIKVEGWVNINNIIN